LTIDIALQISDNVSGLGRFFMTKSTFATVISCMDGRIQEPLREFAVSKFDSDFEDSITDRGGLLRNLAQNNEDLVENILQDIKVSLEAHKSKAVVIAGHQSCAGYPIPDDQKKKEILAAARKLGSKFPGVEIVPVFVCEKGSDWVVEEL
jgi:carbonic anhydrase